MMNIIRKESDYLQINIYYHSKQRIKQEQVIQNPIRFDL